MGRLRDSVTLGVMIGVVASVFPVLPASAAPAVDGTDSGGRATDRVCQNVSDTWVANGSVIGCLEASTADPYYLSLVGWSSGLNAVGLGSSTPPGPSQCPTGHMSREDGWTWKCALQDGQHVLVQGKPWQRPVTMAYGHTASPARSTVTVSSTASLKGCRLSASDDRLLRGQQAALSGQSARRTLGTAGLKPGRYRVTVTCPNYRLNAATDLLVRTDGSPILRSDCIDAWHDRIYADIVPGYGRRLGPGTAAATTAACRGLDALTADEQAQAGREAYLRIGQIAEREVRRVSAARGIPICEAIGEVFHPVDTVGRTVVPRPHAELGMVVPVAGYRADGYFPILNRQWAEGPVAMETLADCTGPAQSLMLASGTWGACTAYGVTTGYGFGADPHQMYPTYVFDVPECPTSFRSADRNPSAVCIVWGDRIGNDVVGGIGKVFAVDARDAAGGTFGGFGSTQTYDCQDRALRTGQFADVGVQFAPRLA